MSIIAAKVAMEIIPEIIPEKVSEEEGIDFKQRQRRRSSVGLVHVTLPQLGKIRRDSIVSITDSYCKLSPVGGGWRGAGRVVGGGQAETATEK